MIYTIDNININVIVDENRKYKIRDIKKLVSLF